MIKLAFDARKYEDYGIGTYVRRLLKGFAQSHDGPECTVFVGPEFHPRSPFPSRWRIQTLPYKPYSVAEFVRFGRDVRQSGRSLFHTPHYTTPLAPGVPTVVTVHDLIHLRFPEYFGLPQRTYARFMVGHACRTAELVLTDAEATKRDLVEMIGVRESKIRVIPLGVGEEFEPATPETIAAVRKRRGLPDRDAVFLGNPKPHKGIDILMESFRANSFKSKELSLVVVGGSEADDATIRQMAARAGIADKMMHLRHLPEEELPVILSAARMLVMPSRWEGFGLPVLEAMACGTPVVCTTAGSLPEVAGKAASFVEPDDSGGLADAILSLDQDEAMRSSLRQAGLLHCQRFRWERTVQQTLEAYSSVL